MITLDKSIIQSLALFMPERDIRYYLNGLHVVSEGKTVRLESANGHTLAIHKTKSEFELGWDFIIPNNVISSILKQKPLVKSNFIQIAQDYIGYAYNSAIRFDKVDGIFPTVSKVWPKNADLSNEHIRIDPNYYSLIGKAAKYQKVDITDFITWPYKDRLAFQVGGINGIIMGLRKGYDEPTTMGKY